MFFKSQRIGNTNTHIQNLRDNSHFIVFPNFPIYAIFVHTLYIFILLWFKKLFLYKPQYWSLFIRCQSSHLGNNNFFSSCFVILLFTFLFSNDAATIKLKYIAGFLDKNRDTFSQDLKNLISKTQNVMLKDIFKDDLNSETNGKKMLTLSSQFKTSLELLMKTLGSCHPFFVRCIKPNDVKKPQVT